MLYTWLIMACVNVLARLAELPFEGPDPMISLLSTLMPLLRRWTLCLDFSGETTRSKF